MHNTLHDYREKNGFTGYRTRPSSMGGENSTTGQSVLIHEFHIDYIIISFLIQFFNKLAFTNRYFLILSQYFKKCSHKPFLKYYEDALLQVLSTKSTICCHFRQLENNIHCSAPRFSESGTVRGVLDTDL
jgi:hypothetical protein